MIWIGLANDTNLVCLVIELSSMNKIERITENQQTFHDIYILYSQKKINWKDLLHFILPHKTHKAGLVALFSSGTNQLTACLSWELDKC